MKWLVVLIIIAVLIAVVAVRYRQQIKMAIYVWRMFRRMRQVGKTGEKQIEKQETAADVALVRCAKCGTWTSQNKSLKLGSRTNYCSTACLETAAKVS